jgi:hypothetical protein
LESNIGKLGEFTKYFRVMGAGSQVPGPRAQVRSQKSEVWEDWEDWEVMKKVKMKKVEFLYFTW